MSHYLYYDHAGWVQMQITTTKKRKPTGREARKAKEQTGWHGAPDKLNFFQKRAICILGVTGGGIYNCPITWEAVIWHPRQIIFPWTGNGFATWDYNRMTTFAMLCHVARMRGGISPNMRGLKIFLSERSHQGENFIERHPNLEEALQAFNSWYPREHMITYPGDKEQFLTGTRHSATWPNLTPSPNATSCKTIEKECLAPTSKRNMVQA